MEEAKVCPICIEEFRDENYRLPRLLQCGHTFCEGCLTKMAKKEKEATSIGCPTCRQETALKKAEEEEGVKALPRNFALLDLIIFGSPSTSKDAKKPFCHSCLEEREGKEDGCNLSDVYCVVCQFALCNKCDATYHSLPLTRKHERIDSARSPPPKLFCKQHTDTPLQLWCVKDSIPVCTLCCHTTHQGHSFDSIEFGWTKAQKGARGGLSAIEKVMTDLENHQKALEKSEEERKAEVQQTKEKVLQVFLELTKAIELRQKHLLDELEDWDKQQTEEVAKSSEEMQALGLALKEKGKCIQEFLGSKERWLHSAALGIASGELLAGIEQLKESTNSHGKRRPPRCAFEGDDQQPLKLIRTFGNLRLRGFNPVPVLCTNNRFKALVADGWRYTSKQEDRIVVTVSSDIELWGITLYPPNGEAEAAITIAQEGVKEPLWTVKKTLGVEQGEHVLLPPVNSGRNLWDIIFPNCIELRKGYKYILSAFINTQHRSQAGREGQGSVQQSNITFTFLDAPAPTNGTSATMGQIPSLLWCHVK